MPQDGPKLRNACENCHRRKIRCQLSANQSACRNCAASGTACLFAPRVKTGRPRLVKTPSVDTPEPRSIDDEDTSGDYQNEGRKEVPAMSVANDGKIPAQSRTSSVQTPSHPWLLDESELHELDELQRVLQSHTSDLDLDMPMDAATDHRSDVSLHSLSHADVNFRPQGDFFTPPSVSTASTTPDELEVADTCHAGLDFNAVLRLCGTFEEHLKSLQETPLEPINTEAILGDIDTACRTVMQHTPDPSATNDASSALVTAALYKVFEICEAFIRSIRLASTSGNPAQETQSAEHLLVLKRLDLVLLRAKIFLTRIGQHNAANKASRISFWIESLVKQQYQHWMW